MSSSKKAKKTTIKVVYTSVSQKTPDSTHQLTLAETPRPETDGSDNEDIQNIQCLFLQEQSWETLVYMTCDLYFRSSKEEMAPCGPMTFAYVCLWSPEDHRVSYLSFKGVHK